MRFCFAERLVNVVTLARLLALALPLRDSRLTHVSLCLHRVSAFVGILSLVFSAPFVGCSGEKEGRCDELFVWFVVITCVDFIVSVVYTIQAIARFEYAVYLHVHKDRVSDF